MSTDRYKILLGCQAINRTITRLEYLNEKDHADFKVEIMDLTDVYYTLSDLLYDDTQDFEFLDDDTQDKEGDN